MIRIELNNSNLKVWSSNEKINTNKAKDLLRLGSRISNEKNVNALIIEINTTVRVDRSALKLIEKVFYKLNQLPIIFINC